MKFSYNKLWKILIDKGMMKKDLAERANITSTTMAKMGKDMPVSMEILGRICVTFRCNIGDIVDVVIDDTKEETQTSNDLLARSRSELQSFYSQS